MKETNITVEIASLSTVRRVAAIMGKNSAADMALKEYQRRKEDGEDVSIFKGNRQWIVGPTPDSIKDSK